MSIVFHDQLTYQSALLGGRDFLKSNNIESYIIDARILLQEAANFSHEELIAKYYDIITNDVYDTYINFLSKRGASRPIAQITGYKEFYGREFKVTEDTLTPRPESELIIDASKEVFKGQHSKIKILDLGTGSGCLILSLLLEFSNAFGCGIDISEKALDIAKINAQMLGVKNRVEFHASNWFENVPQKKYDLIISNPPYIQDCDQVDLSKDVVLYEPHTALFGGKDGLDPYRIIIPKVKYFLNEGGFAIFEFGFMQHEEIASIVIENGFVIRDIKSDLAGIKRCIVIRK